MEKAGSFRAKILFLIGLFIVAMMMSAAMPGAEAGTVFAPPPQPDRLGPGESYPESRFGQPPARVQTGSSRGFASRAVEDMETSDEAGGSRSPAGLEYASDKRAPQAFRTQLTEPKPVAAPVSSIEPNSVVARKGVQEVALIASEQGFFPKTVFVSRDVPVRMFVTGSSKNSLCIMMDSFQVRKQVRAQRIEEITFTPNVPGKYRFYCPINGMEGVMVVKELVSNIEQDDISQSASAPHRAPARAETAE